MALPVKILDSYNSVANSRFGIYSRKINFVFTPPPEGVNDVDWLYKGVDYIADYVKHGAEENDRVGFTFSSPNLSQGPGYIAYRQPSEIKGKTIFEVVSGLVQSNREKSASWYDKFEIEVTHIKMPSASVKTGTEATTPNTVATTPNYGKFLEHCKKRRGIITVDNSDNLSLPKAIVVGKALLKQDNEYELIRKNRKNRQVLKARELLSRTGLCLDKFRAGKTEIDKISKTLDKHNLTIYDYDPQGNKMMFEKQSPDIKQNITLLHCNGHFNVVTKAE